jgi:hypothetical protein
LGYVRTYVHWWPGERMVETRRFSDFRMAIKPPNAFLSYALFGGSPCRLDNSPLVPPSEFLGRRCYGWCADALTGFGSAWTSSEAA